MLAERQLSAGSNARRRHGVRPAKGKVEKAMHEHKQGTLKSGSGKKVKNRKQPIAIAMSESGQSNRKKAS